MERMNGLGLTSLDILSLKRINMNNKLALCMIVAPTDREAELLDRCLSGVVKSYAVPALKEIDLEGVGSLADAVDGIFITITGENDKVKTVAEKYGAIVSHCEWNNDFAEARNFNFSQVPADFEYIVWSDTDDLWIKPELLRAVVDKCMFGKIDTVLLKYNYQYDGDGNCMVEHLKTRILKNDKCVEWAGGIHEDFKPNREITQFLDKNVELIHFTDPKRVEDSTKRNKYMSELLVKRHPEDPRSYWNLANSYNMAGKVEEAIQIYLQFLEISQSDEERFMSWQRMSKCYMKINKYDHAIESALESLNLRPWYPDAYHLLGECNFNAGKLRVSAEFLEMGLTKDIPEMESIVWNPLEYTFNPHVLLAEIYSNMDKPRESIKHLKKALEAKPKHKSIAAAIKGLKPQIAKFDIADEIYKKAKDVKDKDELKKLLDTVPEDMKYYPPILSLRNINFAKTETSGKDLVIYCGYTTIEWSPEMAITKGVGGSEEAVIQLAKRFKKKGYNVTIYANVPGQQEFESDGVLWKPFMGWNPRDKQDVVVIWRGAKYLDYDINASKIYFDVHDVIQPSEFTPNRLFKLEKILFKSKVQREYYPEVPDEKCVIIPHGLDIKEFDDLRDEVKRDPYRIINTSSPDRSIKTCMDIMKKVYNKLSPELRMKVKFSQYYGFDVWDTEFENDEQMRKWKDDVIVQMNELKEMGIMTPDSGVKVSQKEITKKYLESGLMLYPSEFFEIGFIGGKKSMLAGCIPLTTNVFAQGEFCRGLKVRSDVKYDTWMSDVRAGEDYGVKKDKQIKEFVDKTVDYLENVERYDIQREEIINYARTFDWDKTADKWVAEFDGE